MRILQISSSRTYGGGERHFADLCRGLYERGHQVYAALRPTNTWQDRLAFLPSDSIFHVSIRNSFGILSASRMAAFAREKKIDIIHAHVARDYIPASIAASLSSESRFVLTRHVLFPLKPFNRFALKNLAKAIAVSDAVKTSLQNVFVADKIIVISNGIEPRMMGDDERSKARAEFRDLHGLTNDALVVGTMGELVELKGHREFVLAANEIAVKIPSARFVIVGRDNTVEKKFRRELKRLVGVLGLADRFLWLDWVDDTRSFFAAQDLFVSASRTESFGMAILEAMASGTPVVATETEGAKELLKGISSLAAINDPVSLAARISEALHDETRRRQMAVEGLAMVAERYSLDRMISETEKLYESLK